MVVKVLVVLAGAEATIFLFDKEEGCHLEGIQGVNFPRSKVLIQEFLSCFPFLSRGGV